MRTPSHRARRIAWIDDAEARALSQIHIDTIALGGRLLLVDVLIATGGTATAAAQLIQDAGAKFVECCFVSDLPELGGRQRLETVRFPEMRKTALGPGCVKTRLPSILR